MSLQKGESAPTFTLYNSEKESVSLSDEKGNNIVLLFFPQAFTGTCTEELCTIRDTYSIYNNLSAKVFGISVDSVFTLAAFKEQQGYQFNLLSDFNKEVSRSYDCIYEEWILDMKGVSKRAAFVIDKEGIIQYTEICPTPKDLPDFEAIKGSIRCIIKFKN